MKNKHLNAVDFSYIRYANVWEDAHLLLKGLNLEKDSKVLSIASAGDNCFSLLKNNPALVVAIDVNPVQLYLTELKKMSIKHLDLNEYEELFGFRASLNRKEIYQKVAKFLSVDAKIYWDQQSEKVEAGLVNEGKFEKYLRLFAKKILPWIHSEDNIGRLLEVKSPEAQKKYYDEVWNNKRWRILFRLFFSKKVMGLLGRDPAFLKYVDQNVGSSILKKAEAHLSSVHAQTNPILKYCLTGSFESYRPNFLMPENYYEVKKNIDALQIMNGYAEDATERFGKFHAFNLSNIFEYMDLNQFRSTVEGLEKAAFPNALFAYWNLLVDRKMSTVSSSLKEVNVNPVHLAADHGFFYKSFNLTQS